MRKISYLMASLMILLSGSMVFAQDKGQFTVNGQLRPRAEYRNGALTPIGEGEKASSFISNRARLSLGYQNDFLKMGFSAQDVSVWGERPQIDAKPQTTGINEAWAELHNNGYFAKIGRQQLAYDDDRILGTLDWNQAGRFHDAVTLGYESLALVHRFHLILAYNQQIQGINSGTYYAGGQPYKAMQTAWYQYKHSNDLRFSILAMNLGFEAGTIAEGEVIPKGKTNYMQTLGGNVWYNIDDLSLFGTAFYQTGKTAGERDVSAYMLAAKGQYKFTPEFSAALGIDYLSGQKDGEKVTRFDPLYGTHHKFYGTMDYFYASAFGNGGLRDLYASLIYKPLPKLTLDLTYHNFASQQSIEVNGANKKGLGSELDLTVTCPIRPYVVLQGGYSMMFGTDAFFQIKGGSKDRNQHWAFLSLNVNPEIFSAR